MSAQALKSGRDHFIGKRRTQGPLRTALQHLMNPPAGSSADEAAPLAGRRILLACDAAGVAEALRQAGAEVAQARPRAALAEQVRTHHGADAIVLDLDQPEALAAARALRACGPAFAAIPLLGLAADPDAFAAAAPAAGIDGLLAGPVESTLLYETLTRLITASTARAQRTVAAPESIVSVGPEPLLNLQRLDSYLRLGMLDDLVNDYLPEMRRLLATLHEAAAGPDVQASLAALHSLLGMSGEAGAQGLYEHVRKVYVPLLESGEWPAAPDWLPQLARLAHRTEEALKAYCAQQARSSAA